jgi:hypothetical protein
VQYELPPAELEKIAKFSEEAKKFRPIMMHARVAGQKEVKQILGTSEFPYP